MKAAKLGEICNPKQWKTISSDRLEFSGYPVYGANGVIGYYSEYNHTERTLLITCRGATCGTLNICEPFSYVTGNAMALDNLSSEVDLNYLYYYLTRRGLNDVITGSAQPQIVRKALENVEIKYPLLTEQRHIAAVLDKVSELISKRKAQLDKLDELVKSRFVEMFGDPVSGVEKWPIHNLEAVAEAVDPQPSHRTPPAEQNGVPYISIKDCDYETGKINFEGARKVSKAILEEHLNRYTLHDGDFIIGKIGTIGKPVFVPARKDYTLSANVVLIKPKIGLVSPHFLKYSFMSSYVTKQFEDAQNSTSQAAFGIQKVRTIKVMNPDTKVQNEFEILAKQVNKTKSTIQKSLDQLETLKKALMQKYFG